MSRYVVFFLCFVALFSCKESDQLIEEQLAIEIEETCKVMFFNDWDEVLSKYDMDKKELALFEQENDFESFATKSNRVYKSFDLDKVKNVDEIYGFVESNSKYVEILTDENGELNFQPVLDRHPIANVINDNMEISIGNEIYRIEVGQTSLVLKSLDGNVFQTLSTTNEANEESLAISRNSMPSFLTKYRACPDVITLVDNTSYQVRVSDQSGPKRITGYIYIRADGASSVKFVIDVKTQQRYLGLVWAKLDSFILFMYEGEIYTSEGAHFVNVSYNSTDFENNILVTITVPNLPGVQEYFAPQMYNMRIDASMMRFWDAIDNVREWFGGQWNCNERQGGPILPPPHTWIM